MAIPSYVYVLVNDGIPNAVKIGFTTRDPEKRAKELSSTGVLYPFKIAYSEYFQDGTDVEKRLHRKFARYRIADNREFFAISVYTAIQALITIKASEPTGHWNTAYDLYLVGKAFELGQHGYPQHLELAKACYRKGLKYENDNTNIHASLLSRLADCLIDYKGITADIEFADSIISLLSMQHYAAWLILARYYVKKSESFMDLSSIHDCFREFGCCIRNYMRQANLKHTPLTENEYIMLINACIRIGSKSLHIESDVTEHLNTMLQPCLDTDLYKSLSAVNKQYVQYAITPKTAEEV